MLPLNNDHLSTKATISESRVVHRFDFTAIVLEFFLSDRLNVLYFPVILIAVPTRVTNCIDV